jgi:hypothetical protein
MTMLYRIVVVCVSLLLLCGSALARKSRASHGAHGAHGTSTGHSSQHQARAKLMAQARTQIDAMSLRSDNVHRLLRKARATKHGVRSRCLDGMLSQIHATERQALLELSALEATRSRVVLTRLARLQTLSTRSKQLAIEASRCGKRYSKRQRVKSGYTVRVVAPRLPRTRAPREISRRAIGN